MPFNKSGPITQEELFELWQSAVDAEGYASPLITQPNSGIELIEQSHAQLATVSGAVDQTFQSLYILPWSGQSNEPASGGRPAFVDLLITRTNQSVLAANWPLVFQPGLAYLHAPFDFSEDGPLQVLTGRRYFGQEFDVLGPGQLGPLTIRVWSEGLAAGYNLPQPNTITILEQLGRSLNNDTASVVPVLGSSRLVLLDQPDVLTPDQIGQYILFTAGANIGVVTRIVGYAAATPGNGGTAILANEGLLKISGLVGTFLPGERVTLAGGVEAVFLWTDGTYMLVGWLSVAVSTGTITGLQSLATATLASLELSTILVPETNTAAWRVLDWALDFGIQLTNPLSPQDGRTPVLDAIGYERKILRSFGESDDVYRERVAIPADVVSPNAIARAMNRVLIPLGIHGCFREVGRTLFRGFFFDGDPNSVDPAVAFAFDLDFDVRPADRYKLNLIYTEFRAFFLITVPPISGGEFGFAFDDHPLGFYDAFPYNNFFDGYPVDQSTIYKQLWNAIANVVAGGVGFDIVLDGGPCT